MRRLSQYNAVFSRRIAQQRMDYARIAGKLKDYQRQLRRQQKTLQDAFHLMRQKEADYVDARAMELVAVRHGRVGARATEQLTRDELAEVTKHILCPSRMPWDDHTNTSAAVKEVNIIGHECAHQICR